MIVQFPNIKWVKKYCFFAFFLTSSFVAMQAQSIPGTGTSAAICGDCTPTGWADADPDIDGTPDISNRNEAGGEGYYGAGATWENAPLPLPPTNDVRWITIRDVGPNYLEENVTTTMTGLIPGKTYRLRMYSMTSITNQDGGTGGNETYGGVYIDVFDVQVGSNPRRTIGNISRDVWGTTYVIFVAEAASETFTLYPGDGATTNQTGGLENIEMIHISVDDVNALELLDSDGDGIDDTNDIDDDNDGVLDTVESDGNDPNGDEDGDGIPNFLDVNDDGTGDGSSTNYTDSNGDGLPDAFDFDGDGVPNHLDLDSDNDGILDNVEAQASGGGFVSFSSTDSDGDGLVDVYDATPNGTAAGENSFGITPIITDAGIANVDSTPDYLDIDSDDDGIPDNVEAQSTLGYVAPTGDVGLNGVDSAYENVDTYTPVGISLVDTNNDSEFDYRDSDSDGDGITDIYENGDGNTTLSGIDFDGDGLDDNFDSDNSNYDVNDDNDNPSTSLGDDDNDVNSGGDVNYRDTIDGLDSDGDGIPDNVDIDDDNDGILDVEEGSNVSSCETSTTYNFTDLASAEANWNFSSPDQTGLQNANTARQWSWDNNDTSSSGVGPNIGQGDAGYVYTEMSSPGANGDVFAAELDVNFNASGGGAIFSYYFGYRGDGNNGTIQLQSNENGAGWVNRGNAETLDQQGIARNSSFAWIQKTVDLTGLISGNSTRFRLVITQGSNGTSWHKDVGLDSVTVTLCTSGTDTDGDGIPNYLDIDSDNDGITDNVEAQTTSGYEGKLGEDVDNDGLDDAYDDDLGGASNSNGITAAEIVNTDGSLTNSDNIPDYLDIDSDNDGIPDNIEAQTSSGYVAPNGIPGVNGLDSAYDFTDNYDSVGLSSTLVNTDGDAEPDYRDTDSDGDAIDDDNEGRFGSPSWVGTDTDGDGLDDGYDNVDTSGTGVFDVNDDAVNGSGDIISEASGGLIDADGDASTVGDYDYRDGVDGLDTDGDGVTDDIDIDDDNDGIIDTEEGLSSGVGFCSVNSVTSESGTVNPNNIIGSIDGNYVTVNTNGDNIVVDFGEIYPAGTIYEVTWRRTAGESGTAEMILSESTDNSSYTLHPLAPQVASSTVETDAVTANVAFRYLRITKESNPSVTDFDIDAIIVSCPNLSRDTDGDGIPDYLDLDSDNDGILDNVEAQTIAGFQAPPTTGIEAAVGANGLFSIYENGDDTPSATGIIPKNTAADSTPDYIDIDADDDGIPDNVEAQSTQGYIAPTGNVGLNGVDSAYETSDTFITKGLDPFNFDGTDEPDYVNSDSDNDGISDANESGIALNPGTLGTDSDGDGLDDIYEGSDATSGESYDVNDEINDPVNNLLDADGDGAAGQSGDVDYRDTESIPDTDGDGVPNDLDLDDDNDGILDTVEDGVYDAEGDEDNDGILNYQDTSDDGDGGPGGTTSYNDSNSDGIPDVYDSDLDGVPNHLDIDADNDGIPDNVEAQSTLGYVAPTGDDEATYITNSGVNSAYLGGLTPIDTDTIINNNGDAVPDYLDEDSDGDGINDILENGNANTLLGTDEDGDGYDDAFEGVLVDNDVNDDIDDPTTDLPDLDSDVGTDDVDYRDIDDDRVLTISPGHILWLRGDIGLTSSLWEDQTGSVGAGTKFDATGNNTPTVNDSGLNFNPTAVLNGSNENYQISQGIFGNTAANAYSALWIYGVSTRTGGSTDANIFSHDVDGSNVISLVAPAGNNLSFNTGVGSNTLTSAYGSSNGTFNIWNGGFDNDDAAPSDSRTTIYRDGLQLATNDNTGTFGGDNGDAFIGSQGGTFLQGEIAEVMVYTSVPSDEQQQQIQSYLAIKYGITLDQTDIDNDIEEGDYILEDLSTVVWDESANSTYHNDVAGIGRDDGMFLNQKQSKSIYSSALLTIGLGDIQDNNANNGSSFNSNKSFLMWGHNGSVVNSINVNTRTLLCESEKQIDRVWKIVESGSVGTVEIAAEQSIIDGALTTPNSEIILLKVADDANFTTNVKHIPVTSRSVNGTNHYVADFDFDGTKYFTYTEVLGIFWNGNSNSWNGGAGSGGAPATDAVSSNVDGDKVLVIDSESSRINAIMSSSANVSCTWVKPNSKLVLNNGIYLEMQDELYLEGEIRLIGDAQIVQSHSTVSKVSGNGKLYRDQEASVPNPYRYHYWSSPVVGSLGATSFQVKEVMKDGTTPTSESSKEKEINFVSYNGSISSLNGAPTDPITISNYWIYTYYNATERANWVQKFDTGNINVAEGYTMKSTGRAPQNFTFVGTPNDGTISKSISGDRTALLGNPYPSVMDAGEFISDNSNSIDGTIYFWEHTGETTTTGKVEGHGTYDYIGGYSQRNQVMGVAANAISLNETYGETAGYGSSDYKIPSQYIAVGQGFFVSAPPEKGGVITFNNSQRAASTNNVLFKSGGKKNKITAPVIPNFKIGFDYLNSNNVEIHRQLGINFKDGNSISSYDSGYDSSIFDLQPTDMFWDFPNIESNLIIAGVEALTSGLQIPIGFAIDTEDPVTISIDETQNLGSYKIHLVDLITGQIFSLESEVQLDLPKGTYADRFLLVLQDEARLAIDKISKTRDDMLLYINRSENSLVLKNSDAYQMELYSVSGLKIVSWKGNSSQEKKIMNLEGVMNGVYIVRIYDSIGVSSKKIILY